MSWPIPVYSRSKVNAAGEVLLNPHANGEDRDWALEVLNNWRSCHGYPLNTFQATLRGKLRTIETKFLVAQRLKRAPSIVEKLKRFPNMKLARMQDIGGLRAVVSSPSKVRALESNYRSTKFSHQLVDEYDYISHPKKSGYRGVHLVYRYSNESAPEYDGLLLELQIRTKYQHIWATAVETAGIFLDQALKSSEGSAQWLSFFSLTASAFAHLEKSPPVPGYEAMPATDTYKAVVKTATKLKVIRALQGFTIAANTISTNQLWGTFHLVVLDISARRVQITAFARDFLDHANEEYSQVERRIAAGEPLHAVLVSAGPIEKLKRAYPNFFLDTGQFVGMLNRIETLASTK